MVDIASAPRGFRVNTYERAGQVMVSVHGDLDLSSVSRLDAALKRVVEAGGYRDIIVDLADGQVVDMTGVSRPSSDGLSPLLPISARKRSHARGAAAGTRRSGHFTFTQTRPRSPGR